MTADPSRVASLMERERARFIAAHPRSRALGERADGPLLSGVPMNWMTRWPGDFPLTTARSTRRSRRCSRTGASVRGTGRSARRSTRR